MGVRRIGFEGKLYYGTAGSTAATELTIARDVSYKIESTSVDVTDRASIFEYSRTATVKVGLEFEVNNDASNAFVAAVRAAATAGTAIAFRTRDYSSGYGLDGDFIVSLDESQPLKDAQRIKVSAMPTNDLRSLVAS
jgi:hypothetical protein